MLSRSHTEQAAETKADSIFEVSPGAWLVHQSEKPTNFRMNVSILMIAQS